MIHVLNTVGVPGVLGTKSFPRNSQVIDFKALFLVFLVFLVKIEYVCVCVRLRMCVRGLKYKFAKMPGMLGTLGTTIDNERFNYSLRKGLYLGSWEQMMNFSLKTVPSGRI